MTLTEFLLARFDDDERAARKLAEVDRRPVLSLAMTVNHPERLLLEIEAKRRLVEQNDYVHLTNDPLSIAVHDLALHHLVAVYVDHPDFDPAWKVER